MDKLPDKKSKTYQIKVKTCRPSGNESLRLIKNKLAVFIDVEKKTTVAQIKELISKTLMEEKSENVYVTSLWSIGGTVELTDNQTFEDSGLFEAYKTIKEKTVSKLQKKNLTPIALVKDVTHVKPAKP